jgi:hypothetical protein
MKRRCLVLVATVLLASPVRAQVTITSAVTVGAASMTANGSAVVSIKGTKGRMDGKVETQELSVLTDTASRQQWKIDRIGKTVEPFTLQGAGTNLPVVFGDSKVSLKPTGETKTVLGLACGGFAVDLTVPVTLAGQSLTMKIVGRAWIAKEGPGIAEYRAFYKAAADAGLAVVTGVLPGFGSQPLADLQRALADAGLTLEQEIQTTIEGGVDQIGQMLSQLGSISLTVKVTTISTDPIPDSTLALPEGYKKK